MVVNVVHLPECQACQQSELSTEGHALCACGTLGDHEPTYARRRAWHTAHVDTIIRAAVDAGTTDE